jgi:hypothetical protein
VPPLARPTSDLEHTYNAVFHRLTRMIERGSYPFARDEDVQYQAPRVGDGVVVLDADGRVEYNSPNAVSALHRLGVHRSAEGRTLGELGLDDHVVRNAFAARAPRFTELEREPDITVVLHCIPLLEHDTGVTGAPVGAASRACRRDHRLPPKDATIRGSTTG